MDENIAHVPPPPVELAIRTMATDIEAVRASGGQPQNVSVKFSVPQVVESTIAQPIKPKMDLRPVLWILGAIAAAVIFFLVGYFFLFPLLGSR